MLRTRLLGKRERELTMVFESFGFKHGIPIDADYVFDVRFLPNSALGSETASNDRS